MSTAVPNRTRVFFLDDTSLASTPHTSSSLSQYLLDRLSKTLGANLLGKWTCTCRLYLGNPRTLNPPLPPPPSPSPFPSPSAKDRSTSPSPSEATKLEKVETKPLSTITSHSLYTYEFSHLPETCFTSLQQLRFDPPPSSQLSSGSLLLLQTDPAIESVLSKLKNQWSFRQFARIEGWSFRIDASRVGGVGAIKRMVPVSSILLGDWEPPMLSSGKENNQDLTNRGEKRVFADDEGFIVRCGIVVVGTSAKGLLIEIEDTSSSSYTSSLSDPLYAAKFKAFIKSLIPIEYASKFWCADELDDDVSQGKVVVDADYEESPKLTVLEQYYRIFRHGNLL